MKLSDLKCRKVSATSRPLKLSDGGGLYLHVGVNGAKLWRLAYRFDGKQRVMSFGPYPHVGLLDARKRREQAKDLLRARIDPMAEKRASAAREDQIVQQTFGAFADLYLERQAAANRSEPTLKKARWILEDLSADLRARPVSEIRPREVLQALRKVEAKGNRETARRMRGVLSAVFRLAVIEDACDSDPTASLRGALLPPVTTHHAARTEPEAFGALLRAIDGYTGHVVVRRALQILALTFPRPGELRQAQWSEVDLAAALWVIPAERTKMRREHRIPLSTQALAEFKALRQVTGDGILCFPSIRAAGKPLSDGALNAALRALGISGDDHVAHGFRGSASTLLNEHSDFDPDVIERALAHGEPDKIRRAYNRATYWNERKRLMQWWADYCDALRLHRSSSSGKRRSPSKRGGR